jgi:hypothetical protein
VTPVTAVTTLQNAGLEPVGYTRDRPVTTRDRASAV